MAHRLQLLYMVDLQGLAPAAHRTLQFDYDHPPAGQETGAINKAATIDTIRL